MYFYIAISIISVYSFSVVLGQRDNASALIFFFFRIRRTNNEKYSYNEKKGTWI